MVDSEGFAAAAAAFVLPNQPIDPATPLTRFAVPLAAVESVSGLVFFPALLSDGDKAHLDQSRGKKHKHKGPTLPLAQNAAKVLAPEWHRALLAKQRAQKGASSNDGAGRSLVLEGAFWESRCAAVGGAVRRDEATTPGGDAPRVVARHLCDVADCKLPKEIWNETRSGKRAAPQEL